MPYIPTPEQETVLMLCKATYASNQSLQIALAEDQIRTIMYRNYPKSISKLQPLLTLKQQVQLNTRKSLITHIKKFSLQLKRQLQVKAQHNQQILINHKRFLHDIEHILANNHIEAELKQPIAQAYVKLFTLFMPESYEKLISKARYYFNTKEDTVGLHILRSYHDSQASFRYKYEFYGKVITLLAEYICQKLKAIQNNSVVDTYRHLAYLESNLQLFVEIWASMNFQKYESIFMKELGNQKLLCIFQMALRPIFPRQFLHHVYLIASNVLSALRRTGLYKKQANFCHLVGLHITQVLKLFLQKSFLLNDMSQDRESSYLCASLKLLIAGVDTYNQGLHLITHDLSLSMLYSKIMHPAFKNIQKYIQHHSANREELQGFLDDISFTMNSECPQVLIIKFLSSLTKNSPLLLKNIKSLICTFLFDYLPQFNANLTTTCKGKYCTQETIAFVCYMATLSSPKEQLLSILSLIATNVIFLINDKQFLSDLTEFMGLNHQFFLQKDTEIELFSLLIYRNYRSDAFNDSKTFLFKAAIINKAFLSADARFNSQFRLKILEEQFKDKPLFSDIASIIENIIVTISENFNEKLLDILLTIAEKYSAELVKLRAMAQITQQFLQILEKWASGQVLLNKPESYIELIGIMIPVVMQQDSQALSSNIFQIIIKSMTNLKKLKGDCILNLFTKVLKSIGFLPQFSQQVLKQLSWEFNNIQLVNGLTQIIKYSTNEDFLNWLMQKLCQEDFTLQTAFIIQTLTYYKGSYLSLESIKSFFVKIYQYHNIHSHQPNYIQGKLNISCLFLMRCRKPALYELMLRGNWEQLQHEVRRKAKFFNIFSPQENSFLPTIQWFFNMLYLNENVYRSKYDIEVFLITQLKLFQAGFNDQYQLAYANVAMVACITNVIRVYEHFSSENQELILEIQGQEIASSYQMSALYQEHSQFLQSLDKPAEFTEDYFVLFRNWIKKLKGNQSSNMWLFTILKKTISVQNCSFLEQILKIERCNGQKMRPILKIKKIKGQINQ